MRPGRRNAGSTLSMRFVVAITIMFGADSRPSRFFNKTATIFWLASCESLRLDANASISSHKIIENFLLFFAMSNTPCIIFSPTPTHFEPISATSTLIKFPSTAAARASASKVFPVPDGPYSSTPFGNFVPHFL